MLNVSKIPANVATGKCRDFRDRQKNVPANVATGKCRDRQIENVARHYITVARN